MALPTDCRRPSSTGYLRSQQVSGASYLPLGTRTNPKRARLGSVQSCTDPRQTPGATERAGCAGLPERCNSEPVRGVCYRLGSLISTLPCRHASIRMTARGVAVR
jgi:hypothetical protein